MSRKRMIDPGIWTDEGFLELSLLGRLLFIGLVSHADDEGRGSAAAKALKARIFSGDDITTAEVDALKSEVQAHLRVTFYTVENTEYYQLDRWHEYQKMPKTSESTIPPCSEMIMNHCRNDDEPLSPKERKKERKKEREKERNNVSPQAAVFDEWYNKYPRRVGKQAALKAWQARLKAGVSVEELTKARVGYSRHLATEKTEVRYVLHPATFLGPNERWKDYLQAQPHGTAVVGRTFGGRKCPKCGAENRHTGTMCIECDAELAKKEGGP